MLRFPALRPAALLLLCVPALTAGTAFADGDPAQPPAPADPAKQAKSEVDAILERLGDEKSAVARVDGVLAAKSVQDPKLVPALVKLLKDENRDVRFAAAEVLGTRESEDQKKKASEALAARIRWLDKAESDTEMLVVVKALHKLAQPNAIEALLDGVHDDSDHDVVEARVMAVANIPCADAIERLIDYMSRRRRDGSGIPALFAKALTFATGERGANDPDVWRKWWKEHKATFDFDEAAKARAAAENAKAEKEARKNARGSKGDGKGKDGGEKGDGKGQGGGEKK